MEYYGFDQLGSAFVSWLTERVKYQKIKWHKMSLENETLYLFRFVCQFACDLSSFEFRLITIKC
jgi:hypothetical protein